MEGERFHWNGAWENLWGAGHVYILIVMVVTWIYTLSKTHRIIKIKIDTLTTYKFYFNIVDLKFFREKCAKVLSGNH